MLPRGGKLQCPDFDDRVPPARDHVSVHIPQAFDGARVAVCHQRGMLHARAVVYLGNRETNTVSTPFGSRRRCPPAPRDKSDDVDCRREAYLDTVLARRRDNLARVELQGGHSMIVLESLEDAAGAHVPYLRM